MSRTYNLELTREQILMIGDALNTEAKRFSNMAQNARTGATKASHQTISVWERASGDRYALARSLITQMKETEMTAC